MVLPLVERRQLSHYYKLINDGVSHTKLEKIFATKFIQVVLVSCFSEEHLQSLCS